MESTDIEKIEKMIRDRKEAHKFFSTRSKTYGAFSGLMKETYSVGELDRKTKELMAVSISIVINCEPCLEWHINESLKAGATEQQIIESIDVATETGGGPATVSARFAMKALEYYRSKRE